MARDKFNVTLHAGDPVACGATHQYRGVVKVAAVAQTCITVEWDAPANLLESCCEGATVEKVDEAAERRWALETTPIAVVDIPPPAVIEPNLPPPATTTNRDAHRKSK